jgi:hypothetical protein
MEGRRGEDYKRVQRASQLRWTMLRDDPARSLAFFGASVSSREFDYHPRVILIS